MEFRFGSERILAILYCILFLFFFLFICQGTGLLDSILFV